MSDESGEDSELIDKLMCDRDELKASLIDAVRAIENYCNAHNLWDFNKNHMLYQGSNEQQFLDVLTKLKSQHKFLEE
jgi:hypothetical protein